MRLDCGHATDFSQLADDAMVEAAMVAHSVFEEYRGIKKKP